MHKRAFQNMVGEDLKCKKLLVFSNRAFQARKRTFMHVSGLPPPYFDLKKPILMYLQNMVGKT